jgi:hypothetical protein
VWKARKDFSPRRFADLIAIADDDRHRDFHHIKSGADIF